MHRPLPPRAFLLVALTAAACTGAEHASPVNEGSMTAGSNEITYRVVGQGADTAIVIPGGPGLGFQYLESALEPLSRTHTLIFYHPRGRYESRDTAAFSIEKDLSDVNAIRLHFRLDQINLIGHHYGAGVAAMFASRFPNRVRRQLLLAPFYPRHNYNWDLTDVPINPVAQRRFWDDLAAGLDRNDPAEFCRRHWGFHFVPAPVTDSTVIAELAPAMCRAPVAEFRDTETIRSRAIGSLGSQWDWREALQSLRTPTLVIQGYDPEAVDSTERRRSAVLLHAAETWAGLMPESRILTIRATPWFPWAGQRKALLDAADRFLNGDWPHGARDLDGPPATPTPLGAGAVELLSP